jgi:hypothetical protein
MLVLAACSTSQPEPQVNAMASFVDDYFDALFEWAPSYGTAAGFHEYDTQVEDYSAAAHQRRAETLKALQSRISQLRERGGMGADDAIDADILEGQINAELLDLETLQTWRKNPMQYVGVPGSAIDGLIKRSFAPPEERLRSVVARLRGVPPLLETMQQNIQNPPREFTELSILITRGSVGFFKETVAQWAKGAAGQNSALLAEFDTANAAAVRALEDASFWLENTLLPSSKGAFAIGAENFSKKLLYEEMVDTPLDRLLAIGEANFEKDYQAFVEMARRVDPRRTPAEVMTAMSDDHPTEASLIPDARQTVESIVQFIRDRKIVTIPSEVRPGIVEAPPYLRSYGFAFMDTPGAYETRATEAFYYVSPPEPAWSAGQKEEHLRLFNPPVMKIITIHEAYPGHYIQFLYAKQFPTKTRKLIAVGSNAEGWAHYTEQMMVEEGYESNDPRIRLAQLNEALLRDARYIVGIKLHTEGWTVEQGAKFFEEKAFQEPTNAYSEARRGAYNPTYLYYTLGKLQIYKLREDYGKAKGEAYSLEAFHNDFVRQGSIPIKLVRKLLLPGDDGPSL